MDPNVSNVGEEKDTKKDWKKEKKNEEKDTEKYARQTSVCVA